MIEQVFKNKNKKNAEKYKYISTLFFDIYYFKQKNLFKNYILDPEIKSLK